MWAAVLTKGVPWGFSERQPRETFSIQGYSQGPEDGVNVFADIKTFQRKVQT